MTGPEPVIMELAITGDPGLNTTVPPDFMTGKVIPRVFVSAFVEARVQLETPEAFVTEQAP